MMAFVTIVFAVPVGIILPNALQIKSTANAIYSQYYFLEERNRLGYDIRKASKDYGQALPYIDQLESLSIAKGDELTFITAVESLADDYKVTVSLNLSLDKATSERNGHLPFTLLVNGTFAHTMTYLGALRTLPMTTSITKLSIAKKTFSAKDRSLSSADLISATLEGFVYRTTVATTAK